MSNFSLSNPSLSILLTGFNRFGNLDANPSQEIVDRLAQRARRGKATNLRAEVLPTEYQAAGARMRALIRSERPAVVVSLGLAAGAESIRLERVALNLDDSPSPDNTGVIATGQLIVPEGPVAYRSTLPLEELEQALRARDIPVRISNYAGAFVCNHVFYVARHEIEQLGLDARCGFIHLPLMAEQLGTAEAGLPSLPLAVLIEAVECCLELLGNTA